MVAEKENKKLIILAAVKEDNWVDKDRWERNFIFTSYPFISFYTFVACEHSNYSNTYTLEHTGEEIKAFMHLDKYSLFS